MLAAFVAPGGASPRPERWDKYIEDLSKKQKETGKTVLIALAGIQDRDIIEYYINKYKPEIDEEDTGGATALWHATMAQKLETVELLMELDANVDHLRDNKLSPLMVACMNGDRPIAEALIEGGATVDKYNPSGNTALSLSMQRGHVEMAQLMAARGADVEIDEDAWKTLVMLMMRSNTTADKENLELVEAIVMKSEEKKRIYGIVKEFVANGMKAGDPGEEGDEHDEDLDFDDESPAPTPAGDDDDSDDFPEEAGGTAKNDEL